MPNFDAIALNRRFIGIDIDNRSIETAKKRFVEIVETENMIKTDALAI
ncbi:MAG: hypothetical protein JRD93_22060 [Deltaproteobacteria bacterium]|nr:hypothetical protein [Deltaproteobacteria bacterium]